MSFPPTRFHSPTSPSTRAANSLGTFVSVAVSPSHTHTKVNAPPLSRALSKGTVGACYVGDIKHMEAKYPV